MPSTTFEDDKGRILVREPDSRGRLSHMAGKEQAQQPQRFLRYQQNLSRCLPPFQIPMRLLRLRQRITVFNAQLQLACRNHPEYCV
jgi:hypothetical protein